MAALDSVVVVSLDNLGDLVFASALFPPLRAALPGLRLTVWCKAYAAPLAALIPGVDRVFASDPFWDAAPGRGRGGVPGFIRTVLDVRGEAPQAALVASTNWRAAAAAWAACAGMRVGWDKGFARRFLDEAYPPGPPDRPAVEELGRLLGPFGASAKGLVCRLDPGKLGGTRELWARRLGAGEGARWAVFHPFAGDRRRCVAPEAWKGFARLVARRGWSVLWAGTPEEIESLGSDRPGPSLHAHGRAGLADLAAALACARFFAGHDSGPLHAASALGLPCLGVYTPGEPKRTFPQGTGPFRLLTRPSPEGVSAEDLFAAAEPLL